MSELALQLAQELLSARDVATLLKLTPRAVRLRMSKLNIAPIEQDSIQVWSLDQFPCDYQEQLLFLRKKTGAWTIRDAVEMATPRWVPDFNLATLPEYSQKKAFKVRTVMIAYDAALDDGKTEQEARCIARSTWLGTPIVMSDGEVLIEGCSDKTITRWIKRLEKRGNIEHLRIEAFADRKSCPHVNQRRDKRKKGRIPGETITLFRQRATLPNANLMSAFRSMEMDWDAGLEVPGLGKKTEPNQPFPFTYKQLCAFKPSKAARDLGNQGNAKARRDSLPHITRTFADLRACEMYVMDDTRINFSAWNDETGKHVILKCYVAMEVASRRIVGWVIREGAMQASDVDALMSGVMSTSGIAALGAGYKTIFLFERGSVACSEAKQAFIEAAWPTQVDIRRTSMNGGRNVAGDFVQAASGHWMGKGVMESFMRTLHNITRHIKGQIGTDYRSLPSMMGYPDMAHAGSMIAEAERVIMAARSAEVIRSEGTDLAPHATRALEQHGLQVPTLNVTQARHAFALAVHHYNAETDHRREGFKQVPIEKENGGLRFRMQSSDERWQQLVWTAAQHGKAPFQISAADVSMLLHKARKVSVTPNGVEFTVEGNPVRYWHQDSIACNEAMQLTTVRKEYLALYDPGDLSRIYLLRNSPSILLQRQGELPENEAPRFLECLPLYQKAGAANRQELRKAREATQSVHSRKMAEYGAIHEETIEQNTRVREENLNKMSYVITTTEGTHQGPAASKFLRSMAKARRKLDDAPAQSESRHVADNSDIAAFGATLSQEKA